MSETLKALYSTVMTIYDLFSALSGWLGSRAVIALAGLFFFYRIFRNFFPEEKTFSIVASFGVFTTLWATWNYHYSETYDVLVIAETYGFLALHILAFFLIQKLIHRVKRKFRAWRQRRVTAQPLELYEEVDESVIQIKRAIKEENLGRAIQQVRELEESLKNHANPKTTTKKSLPIQTPATSLPDENPAEKNEIGESRNPTST